MTPESFIRQKISKQRHAAREIRNISWTLDPDRLVRDIMADPRCQLSGQDLVFEPNWMYTVSIDRKDSNRGYHHDNVQWVGVSVNTAKSSLPDEDFVDLCRSVLEHHGYEVRAKTVMEKFLDRRARVKKVKL